MKHLVLGLMMIPSGAIAENWIRMSNDAAVTHALSGRTVVYDAYTFQYFGPSGSTDYITERASTGRWAARAGQYCSTWPPSDTWTCYDLYVDGDRVRFVGADRSESIGTYKE